MSDISGYGSSLRVLASNTFPIGVEVTQFADDADMLDIPTLQISDNAMGLNGDKVEWTTANPIIVTTNVIPATDDDRNLSLLFEANRAGKNKSSAQDVITMIASYPDGQIVTLTGGSCREYMPARSVASEGRLKSKSFAFAFENMITVG